MKTEVQLTSKQITIEDLKNTDHVGFVDHYGGKWQAVLGTSGINAICHNHPWYEDKYQIAATKPNFKELLGWFSNVQALYKFDDRSELYQWLAE
jgi:hypothetical protein